MLGAAYGARREPPGRFEAAGEVTPLAQPRRSMMTTSVATLGCDVKERPHLNNDGDNKIGTT